MDPPPALPCFVREMPRYSRSRWVGSAGNSRPNVAAEVTSRED